LLESLTSGALDTGSGHVNTLDQLTFLEIDLSRGCRDLTFKETEVSPELPVVTPSR